MNRPDIKFALLDRLERKYLAMYHVFLLLKGCARD